MSRGRECNATCCPSVEGTTVQTRYGYVSTDHIPVHRRRRIPPQSPQRPDARITGRFPIRVELNDLTKDDFVRILKEPKSSLTRQYEALLQTEGVALVFTDDAMEALATHAHKVNQSTQNIGARRLYTILERMLEELSFEAPEMKTGRVVINAAYVNERLQRFTEDEDLSKYIL